MHNYVQGVTEKFQAWLRREWNLHSILQIHLTPTIWCIIPQDLLFKLQEKNFYFFPSLVKYFSASFISMPLSIYGV